MTNAAEPLGPERARTISIPPVGLEGILNIPAGARGIVLFAHGSGSSRLSPRNTYVAEALRHVGLATLLFDLLSVLEFPKEDILFVLNKTDRRSGITAEAVSENLKHEVEGEIPLDDRTVATSVNRGEPILLGDKSRPIAKDLLEHLATVKQRLMAEDDLEAEGVEGERSKVFGR